LKRFHCLLIVHECNKKDRRGYRLSQFEEKVFFILGRCPKPHLGTCPLTHYGCLFDDEAANRLVSKQTYRSSRNVIAKAVCAVQSSGRARNRHKSTRKTMKFLVQRLDCTRKITALQWQLSVVFVSTQP